MNSETKLKLFEEMLKLEDLAQYETFDNRDYFEQSCGAYKMLEVLGLDTEYVEWSYGKMITATGRIIEVK